MTKHQRPTDDEPPRWYRGAHIPMRVIRGYARRVAERFRPDKIILFGSYAYGTPHGDSDVDLLVIMPARNEIDQAVRIDRVIDPLFPLDLIVCTPKHVAWRLKEGDGFLREIVTRGKVLYEKADGPVGAEGGVRLHPRPATRPRKRAPYHDQACFHCQQSAEKYLKALLVEQSQPAPRTQVLEDLISLLLPHHASLAPLRRGARFLTRFAVATRYPGKNATRRQTAAALRGAGKVRTAARALLGLRERRPRRKK
jgi:HEPN domain-containing protein/predicted nucleotidyltransferase